MIPSTTRLVRLCWLSKLPQVSPEKQIHLERYKKFILSRPLRLNCKGKQHKHHIFPKSMMSETKKDRISNLILLSTREHFIVHLMLWKCGYPEMVSAFWRMSTGVNKSRLSGRQYEKIKADHGNRVSILLTNRVFSQETKQKQSIAAKKRCETIHPTRGKKHTESSKRKNSESQKALYQKGYVNPNKGKPMSSEAKKHLSEIRIQNRISAGENNPRAKAVICLETNKKYTHMKIAAYEVYGKERCYYLISKSIKQNITVKGFTWKYVDEEIFTHKEPYPQTIFDLL